MATPTNTSGLLQSEGVSSTSMNVGFTGTAGRQAILKVVHYEDVATNLITAVTFTGTSGSRLVRVDPGSNNQAEIWFFDNITGGSQNISFTYGGGSQNYISFSIEEYAAGTFPSSPTDAGTPNTATGTSTAPSVATAVTTSQANTHIAACVVVNGSVANANLVEPAGYTRTFRENDSTSHEGGIGAYKTETSAGIKTATFSSASIAWCACIVALKENGGATTTGRLVNGNLVNGSLVGSLAR